MKKRMLTIFFENSINEYLTKDMCAYPYHLAKDYQWGCTYAYFTNGEKLSNPDFERYCKLQYLGKAEDYKWQQEKAKQYLKEHITDYDVVTFFNYGGATYRLSHFIKKLNPNVVVYSKLDMSDGGFSHFYDGTVIRQIKNLGERWKSRDVDIFTVENRHFYDVLKNIPVFKNRIYYLPDCVSLFGVPSDIDTTAKDNIVITVGRLGIPRKNNEMLIRAMRVVDQDLFRNWKVLFVGRDEGAFVSYLNKNYEECPWLRDHLIYCGEIRDRVELYKLYAKSKIICMTSRKESVGIATIEAMFFGAYPIITNYGCIVNDITSNGKYGKVLPQDDSQALADALTVFVQADQHKSYNGQYVQNFARKEFSYPYWCQGRVQFDPFGRLKVTQ